MRHLTRAFMAASLAMAGVADGADDSFRIIGQPRANEPVIAEVDYGDCEQLKSIRFEGGIFGIVVGGTLCSIPQEIVKSQRMTIGQLPAGHYRAQLLEQTPSGLRPRSEPVGFDVAPIDEPGEYDDFNGLYDEGGIWWNGDALKGESIVIEHATGDDRLYAVWNTYLPDGRRDWRVMLCEPPRYGVRNCTLYQSTPASLALIGTAKLESRSFWNHDDRLVLMLQMGDHTRSLELFRYDVDRLDGQRE